MVSFVKNLFRSETKINFAELVKNGAIILDVRTKKEFENGHMPEAINIPLDLIRGNVSRFNKNSVIITCSAPGKRSASAKSILNYSEFHKVYNAGNWLKLKNQLN
jgi:phage shock protein E